MSGQVRKNEVWAKAVVNDGRKGGIAASVPEPVCGQEPRVGDEKKLSNMIAWKALACRIHEKWANGRLCRLRVREKATCWRAKPSGQKRQSCGSCVRKSKRFGNEWKEARRTEAK